MFYIIITIGLLFFSAFTFLPRFKSFVENYSLGINFFLTLIATLIGVLLAISITNYDSERKEKQDVIKLLESSINSVEASLIYTEQLIEYFDKLPEKDEMRKDFYLNNPLPYPDYLDTFLMQSMINRNLSGTVLSTLNINLINLKRTRTSNYAVYLSLLNNVIEILKLEVSFQNAEIPMAQFKSQVNHLKYVTTYKYISH